MSESKKVVIKVDIHDDYDKRKVLKAVSGISGIDSLTIDIKDQKLTITGDVDPVEIVGKLKKWHTDIVTVGPAKEPPKPPKPEDVDDKAKKEQKEKEEAIRRWMEYYYGCRGYNSYQPQRLCLHPVEEYPTGCVIC